MNVGIIGAEAAKFTKETETTARQLIHRAITECWPDTRITPTLVSGHCHLGGIDIWAEEEFDLLREVGRPVHALVGTDPGFKKLIFPPKIHQWEGGYKPRNIQIAKHSDIVYVIVPAEYPDSFKGQRFKVCYHCIKRDLTHHPTNHAHIKSGACWTAWHAYEKFGKPIKWFIVG